MDKGGAKRLALSPRGARKSIFFALGRSLWATWRRASKKLLRNRRLGGGAWQKINGHAVKQGKRAGGTGDARKLIFFAADVRKAYGVALRERQS